MQVASGPYGKEKVHWEAPGFDRLDTEMKAIFDWFEQEQKIDPVIKAAIAHLWFVTIHPFDDGNGRIARAIADRALARSENSPQRFYSISVPIRAERQAYYDILKRTQKGDLDITDWLGRLLTCLDHAFAGTEAVIGQAKFWDTFAGDALNERQQAVLNRLLDGFVGKLTSSNWATITKTSQDTATRDISDLVARGTLLKGETGGRSTSYSLVPIAK